MLYKIITHASTLNVDALRVLKVCAAKFDMAADWSMKPNTTCPSIALNATTVDFLMGRGSEPVLGPSVPTWAWSNLLQAAGIQAMPKHLLEDFSDAALGIKSMQVLLLTFMCIPLVVLFVHHVLLKPFSLVYRSLAPVQQFVTCQHGVFAVTLGLQLVPQTALAIRFLFKAWTANYFLSGEPILLLCFFLMTHGGLYLIEACLRATQQISWLLLFHHLSFFVIIVIGFWAGSFIVLAMGIVLDLFVSHEVFLYVVLLAYRLKFPVNFSLGMLWGACGWYVVTRVMQTIILMYMIVGWAQNPAVKYDRAFIATSVLCGILTVIQFYTLHIYKGIREKLLGCAPASVSAEDAAAAAIMELEPEDNIGSTSCLENTKSLDSFEALNGLEAVKISAL